MYFSPEKSIRIVFYTGDKGGEICYNHREEKGSIQMVSKSQRAASRRWIMRNYDLITLRVPIGQRAKIREYAAATGESMNGLIRRAIRELMEREVRIPNGN